MSDAFEEFGPYRVYERLGQGGMATVHRAEKRGVGIRRPIALKRLLPHVATDPALVKLFVDEARLASQLHHANVAQTYELGKVGDSFFIAMEYASGPTLAQIVRQCQKAAGEIPLTIAVNILSQVCEALDYAHNLCDESGQPLRIIHRDVSPANIIVTNAGIVKLIDFGIAKATISSVKTQTGFIKGKFGYIAPEYISGKIDARVDLFAVGVVAHEMMAGRRLFEGKDDFETLQNIREMNLSPPSRWNRHVTPDLDDIVMTALRRDPADRWQSAQALQVALANVAREFGLVVGSQQLAEWVDWAFTRMSPDSGPVTGAETDGFGRDARHADSSLSIQVSRISADAIDLTPPPERPSPPEPTPHTARFPSDSDETVPLERVAPPREGELNTPMPELAPPPPPVMPPHVVVPPPVPRSARASDAPPPSRRSHQVEAAITPQRASRPALPFEASRSTPRGVRAEDAAPPPSPPPRPSRAMDAAGPPPVPRPKEPSVPPPIPPPRESEAAAPPPPPPPVPRSKEPSIAPPIPPPRGPEAAGPALRETLLSAAPPPPIPVPSSRELVVPPGVPDAVEPESTLPTSKRAARNKPKTRGRSTAKTRPEPRPAPAARARRAGSDTGPAPRSRRSVLWLILLMIVLGTGATAAAYYWPELYGQ